MPNFLNWIIGIFDGVPIFFCISGFLIWQSIGRSKTFPVYCRKRFWRIFPELWVAVIIEIIVMLVFYEDKIPLSKIIAFAAAQGSVLQFWVPECMKSYGIGSPNGALWTIGVIIQFYFVAFFLFRLLHNKKKSLWFLSILFFVLLSFIFTQLKTNNPSNLWKLGAQTFIPYFWLFIFGAVISEFQNAFIPLFKKCWLLLILVAVIAKTFGFDIRLVNYGFLHSSFLFVGLIGFVYVFNRIKLDTDISYGIYLYHMVFVNVLVQKNFNGNVWYLVSVLLITLLTAYVSTNTVGKVVRNFK